MRCAALWRRGFRNNHAARAAPRRVPVRVPKAPPTANTTCKSVISILIGFSKHAACDVAYAVKDIWWQMLAFVHDDDHFVVGCGFGHRQPPTGSLAPDV
jgi:hypothetical protein